MREKILFLFIVFFVSPVIMNAAAYDAKTRHTAGKETEYQKLSKTAEALIDSCTAIFKNGIAGLENVESAKDAEHLILMIDQDLRDTILPQAEFLKKMDEGAGEPIWQLLLPKVNAMVGVYDEFSEGIESLKEKFSGDPDAAEAITSAMDKLNEWQQGYYKGDSEKYEH
ncbi:MAG: hypothetical protein A2Y33_11805 [Spirochaetes bacterium GWF1_51_8]|nr:MAG: hypothetical protein A2Y33_11805 [Spirochaetes bacterium GWF1_51_8]